MTKTTRVMNNFIRGQLDHDMNGRYDLPIFFNGFEYSRNFYVNYKGCLKNRPGFEYVATKSDCVLKEFRFSKDQTYLMLFTDNLVEFYTYDVSGNFGFVCDLATEMSLADAKKAKFAQNADVIYITHENSVPKTITRTGATTFTWGTPTTTGINYTNYGNPRCCAFYQKRLWLGGFTLKPVTLCGSESGVYTNFKLKTTSIVASDPVEITLSDITDPMVWLIGGKNNLHVGNAEGVSLINGGQTSVVTPTSINASLGATERANSALPVIKENRMFYASLDGRKLYGFQYDLLTENFKAEDTTLVSKDATIGKIKRILLKHDNNDLIYCLMENGDLSAIVYNETENINGWFPFETQGKIHDVETITRPDGKDDLFLLIERDSVFYLERMTDEVEFTRFLDTDFLNDEKQKKYNRLIAEQLKGCNYLDNSSIYKQYKSSTLTFTPDSLGSLTGTMTSTDSDFSSVSVGHYIVFKTKTGAEYGYFRITAYNSATSVDVELESDSYYSTTYTGWYLSFSSVSGFTNFNGKTVSVVADGGYLNDFVVENGTIDLGRECQCVCVGLPYRVLANTFNIGHFGGEMNGQTIAKNVSKYILRFVDSAGAEVGTDVADLQEIQEFNPAGFFDLPPLLMNGDIEIVGQDSTQREKRVYLSQNYPLPYNLTALEMDIDYRRMP